MPNPSHQNVLDVTSLVIDSMNVHVRGLSIWFEDWDHEKEYEDVYAADFDPNELDIQNGDSGEQVVCILQKLLLTPKKLDHTQRNSIFKTRCTIDKKVCNVIIYSNSSENVVSKALVKALGLLTKPHTKPYKIGWIKEDIDTEVTKIYKVPFSIGNQYLLLEILPIRC